MLDALAQHRVKRSRRHRMWPRRLVLIAAVFVVITCTAGGAQAPPPRPGGRGVATEMGFGLFRQRCLSCHGSTAVEKAPTPAVLREMSPERILDALTSGVMKPVGDTLTAEERRLVAESVAGRLLGTSTTGDAAS